MPAELGESQLSALLESVPGLANVLRSPVADAIVHMIRAGAGLGAFRIQDAQELVQYATRRGLIPSSEGMELLEEVERSGTGYRQKSATKGQRAVKKLAKSQATARTKAGTAKPAAKGRVKKTAAKAGTAKTARGRVKKVAKASKKKAKSATKPVKSAGKVSKKKRR